MRFLQKMAEELLENSIWKFKSRDLVAFFSKMYQKWVIEILETLFGTFINHTLKVQLSARHNFHLNSPIVILKL